MGFLSFLDKPFRTGRSKALRSAQQAAEQTAGDIREGAERSIALGEEFLETTKPVFQEGAQSLQGLSELATPEGILEVFAALTSGPLFNTLAEQRREQADQAFSSRGLRRSGGAISEAADVPTDVLMGLLDQIIGTKRDVSQIGLSQGGNIARGISDIVSGISGRSAGLQGIADAQAAKAESTAQVKGGVLDIAGKILGAF